MLSALYGGLTIVNGWLGLYLLSACKVVRRQGFRSAVQVHGVTCRPGPESSFQGILSASADGAPLSAARGLRASQLPGCRADLVFAICSEPRYSVLNEKRILKMLDTPFV